GRDGYSLCERLARIARGSRSKESSPDVDGRSREARENGYRQQTPNAAKGMHGNGPPGIVDAEMQFKPLHRVGDERAGNRANHKGRERADERAGGAAGYQSSNPAIGADGDIGPAKTHARDQDGCEKGSTGSKRCIDSNQNNAPRGRPCEHDSASGVESQPSKEG